MKKFSLRSLAIASSFLMAHISYGQFLNCQVGKSKMDIESENVRAKLLTAGDFFWDPGLTIPQFQWPKDASYKNLIYSGSLWFGGVEAGTSNVLTAVQYYRGATRNFWPGPIDPLNPNGTSNLACSVWDHHYKVDRIVLDSFFLALQMNPMPLESGKIPSQIKYWPGKSNGYLKILAVNSGLTNSSGYDQDLAPFIDINSNGIYDPQNGDYPDLGNRNSMVWWVMNDIGNQKNYANNTTVVPGIGLEFQILASTYPGLNEQNYLENSIFLDIKVINKGLKTLVNSYMGLFMDFDIGYGGDDYLQSDVMNNLAMCFNGDSLDEGSWGYGENPPAAGLKVLDAPGPVADADGYDNNQNGITDEPGEKKIMTGFTISKTSGHPTYGDPDSHTDFYHYLQGNWKDGSDISFGGDGLGAVSPAAPKTSFMFPGISDPYGLAMNGTVQNPVVLPEWSEKSVGNPPGDRKGTVTSGPFVIAPGQAINYSAVTLIGAGGNVQQNVEKLQFISDSLESFLPTLLTSNTERKVPDLSATVFPNPASETIRINGGNDISQIRITDLQGKVIYQDAAYVSFRDIDVRSFSKGVYLVRVVSRSGSPTLKLVVTR